MGTSNVGLQLQGTRFRAGHDCEVVRIGGSHILTSRIFMHHVVVASPITALGVLQL